MADKMKKKSLVYARVREKNQPAGLLRCHGSFIYSYSKQKYPTNMSVCYIEKIGCFHVYDTIQNVEQ